MKRTNCNNNENYISSSSSSSGRTESLYCAQTACDNVMIETRPTGSGFNSFLRWFKRNEKVREDKIKRSKNTNSISDHPTGFKESCETLSPVSTPIFTRKSGESSSESVFSTATTGFAFVSPNNYRPYGDACQPEKLIAAGPITDTYRHRIRQQEKVRDSDRELELTLRRKYRLFQDTIRTNTTSAYADYSLPNVSIKHSLVEEPESENPNGKENPKASRKYRRTLSDGSKYKKPGVHVKGKRRAPPPPQSPQSTSLLSPSVTPSSTLSRNKKRRAPEPPASVPSSPSIQSEPLPNNSDTIESIFKEGFLEDKEIKAILDMPKALTDEQKRLVFENVAKVHEAPDEDIHENEDVLSNDTLKLEKGMLRSTKPIAMASPPPSPAAKSSDNTPTPLSPISPRPWYKRPLSGTRESTSIPFKKEIILRTVDKRRNKKTENENLPEIGFSRNSIFESASKLGFFRGRSSENSAKKKEEDKEKRKSGIGIPSISELDREAAEIVQKEQECERARLQEENEKYYTAPQEQQDPKTTKDLISKFEESSSSPKITINASFIGRSEIFEKPQKISITHNNTDETKPTIPEIIKEESPAKSDVPIKKSEIMESWTCPYCTLENPNWRIICEVCEKIKPYDLRFAEGNPKIVAPKEPSVPPPTKTVTNYEWNVKAEKLRKYFEVSNKSLATGTTLSKSASETSVNKATNNTENAKFGSPKLPIREFLTRDKPDVIKIQTSLDESKLDRLETVEETKEETLRPSSKEAPEAHNKTNLQSQEDLEKEKERIRELIRQMNARALAEKYPVVQKQPPDVTEQNRQPLVSTAPAIVGAIRKTAPPPNDQNKLGAIKKLFARKDKTKEDTPPLSDSKTDADDTKNGKNIYANFPIYENIKETDDPQPLNNVRLTARDNEKVENLTEQLKSQKGLDDFKATLRSSPKKMNNTDTLAINKILRNLESAIADGEYELAAMLAKKLARMKVSLSVTKQKDRPLSATELEDVDVGTEKIFMKEKSITMDAIHDVITEQNFSNEQIHQPIVHNIPIEICTNNVQQMGPNLESHKFETSQTSQLLNIKEAVKTDLERDLSGSENDISDDNENIEEGAIAAHKVVVLTPAEKTNNFGTIKIGWTCSLCTLINEPINNHCIACTHRRPADYKVSKEVRIESNEPTVIKSPTHITEAKNDLNKSQNQNRQSTEIFNIKIEEMEKIQPSKIPIMNRPSHTSIVMTVLNNPNISKNKYRGVDNFNPRQTQLKALELPKPTVKIAPPAKPLDTTAAVASAKPDRDHYQELLNLNNADLILNFDEFDCPICFATFSKGHGIILRDCFHVFCRECLLSTVKYSEDVEIKCPYMDAEMSCESQIQEREIRSFVGRDVYEQHLAKSVQQAEHGIENTFHCKTPNCRGWCIYEDNVNQFKCPVCQITNCLTCQAIHDGLNCKQYQDRINSGCDTNLDAKRTKEMLQGMVDQGEAMNCPTCQVILMKKWGCDWLKCSMCKTEICWVTRGPRWGLGGKGDTTGGCKCGVNGKKCHAQCNYCH